MFKSVSAGGGTMYSSGAAVFHHNGVRIPDNADLIVFAVGDEAGETGDDFASYLLKFGFKPSAFAHIVNVARGWSRGSTVRRASEILGVPYTEVDVGQFQDVAVSGFEFPDKPSVKVTFHVNESEVFVLLLVSST